MSIPQRPHWLQRSTPTPKALLFLRVPPDFTFRSRRKQSSHLQEIARIIFLLMLCDGIIATIRDTLLRILPYDLAISFTFSNENQKTIPICSLECFAQCLKRRYRCISDNFEVLRVDCL